MSRLRFFFVLVPIMLAVTHAAQTPSQEPGKAQQGWKDLFDGKSLDGWNCFTNNAWIVKNSVMASTGAGRGVLTFRGRNYRFRVIGLSVGVTIGASALR